MKTLLVSLLTISLVFSATAAQKKERPEAQKKEAMQPAKKETMKPFAFLDFLKLLR